MKRTIEIAKLNVITLSENKKKGHANRNSKSPKPVQLGNPTIKGKAKTKLSRKTIWIIVIGSLFVEDYLDNCDWISFCAYAFNWRYNIRLQ